MLDIHTVGAGGGSLARIDSAGAIRVGPRSASADPGPAAYGKGVQLTVTDANVLLGRLPSDTLLGGAASLDRARVSSLFDEFSERTRLNPEDAAEGILAVVNAQMARALRHISVERGHDPAGYTLMAFGGAGPLHACELAEALRIPNVIIPRFPGAFSALGLALADIRREYARSVMVPAALDNESEILTAIAALSRLGRSELSDEGVSLADTVLKPFLEARYVGQSYALRIPYRRSLEAAARAFHLCHRQRYGHSDSKQPVEIVTIGLTAIGKSRHAYPAPEFRNRPGRAYGSAKLWDARTCSYGNVALYERGDLVVNQRLSGPVIVTQMDSTTFIPSGWTSSVDELGNLRLAPQATS